jgi:hypothetical protein
MLIYRLGPALFITQPYKLWLEEWKEHLFKVSAHIYHNMIDPEYEVPDDIVSPFLVLNFSSLFNFIGNSLLYFNRSMTQHHQ